MPANTRKIEGARRTYPPGAAREVVLLARGVVLRPAVPQDLDAVLEIESAWPTTPHWSRAQFERELISERSYFCVCAGSKQEPARSPRPALPPADESAHRGSCQEAGPGDRILLGYAAMLLVPPEAQVTTVAVRADHAGRGLGRALMSHLHEEARRRGCSSATLEVGEHNAPAIRLYESLGYRIVGRRPKYYNHTFDALLMTCDFLGLK